MNSVVSARRTLARFELLRELGRGAQATVWLAHDPRLQREVAVKLLSAQADDAMRAEWLNEARAVSRLKHPNIVPVFEADEHQGQSYLVFEYVEGPTLQERRRRQPALPAREAVALMLGVLDALAAAHDQGIVHRDLKPSNVLLGGDGRPRVMDFGIAARIDQGDGRIVGTPGYISPQAARGEPPHPSMDVFSAGIMLGEMLAGAPLMHEHDAMRALARVQREDLVLPAGTKVDATLRGIVQRALARDAAQRYDSARSMHAALSAWLTPGEGLAETRSSNATLEFLLRRMRHKSDFPALSASVVRIQRLAMSEKESLTSLTDEILKDVALTNKLLRMVNTVHFTAVAGDGIGTVSRAVALVGFAGIRNMALSVILLEHMGDKGHAALLKEEFLRALMAGTMAADLAPQSREGEEAFLGAMFQNLGRLLTEYYFPEEALQIRQLLGGRQVSLAQRNAAARKVLGLGFDELGLGVARAWGLPDTLQHCLMTPAGEVPARPIDRKADRGAERLRWLARGANEMTDALLAADGDEQADALAAVAEAFGPALGLSPRDMVHSAQGARVRTSQLAQAMGLQVASDAPARRLLAPGAAATIAHQRTLVTAMPPAPATPAQLTQGLEQGLGAVREAVDGTSMRLNEVLNLILETLHRVLDLRCVVFCLRDVRSGNLVGRVALGEGSVDVSAAFRIGVGAGAPADLFTAVCARGADLLVADTRTVANRLPPWYREHVGAATFLLLPLMVKGAPIGLVYADKASAGSIVLNDAQLMLVRGLRDQAVAVLAKGRR